MNWRFGMGAHPFVLAMLATGCASEQTPSPRAPALTGESARVASVVEAWADAIRSRDARRVCRLTDPGRGTARQSLRECVADLRDSQEFASFPRFEVVRVQIRGARAEARVRISEESGDAWPNQIELGAIRSEGRWRVAVAPG